MVCLDIMDPNGPFCVFLRFSYHILRFTCAFNACHPTKNRNAAFAGELGECRWCVWTLWTQMVHFVCSSDFPTISSDSRALSMLAIQPKIVMLRSQGS